MDATISEKIWQCFKVISKAGNEANGLLSEIEDQILGLSLDGIKIEKELKKNGNSDSSGWLYIDATRNFKVTKGREHRVLVIQIVFYSEEPSKACDQSILNVLLTPWDCSDPLWRDNYLGNVADEQYWEGTKLFCNGKLFSNDGGDKAFSLPIHSIGSPTDIGPKVIEPVKALLHKKQPEELDSELLKDALMFEGEGVNIRIASKR